MAIKGKSCDKCPDDCSSGSSIQCGPRASSPCRLSRIAEKSELQNLNDRLACYIDRARKLEIENNRLKIELAKEKECDDEELNNVKGVYEEKLCDQKHCIDEVAREKSKLDMEIARLWEENDDLQKQLEKALKDLFSAENRARCLDSQLTETCQKYKCTVADLNKCNDTVEFLKNEVERYKKLLEDARTSLECETLNRVQGENNLCNMRDQMQRHDQVHDQEMKENVAHRLAEVNEMNSRLTTQYEAKLRHALHELREQYEGQIRTNRCQIELIYENKIEQLEKASSHCECQASLCQDELQSSRNCVSRLNDHIDELGLEIEQLKHRVREMEKNSNCERTRFKNNIASLEGEVQKLRCEISRRIKEYQDLMDIKVSLDMEISAYDKLLKGEESRFGGDCNACDLEDDNNDARDQQPRKMAVPCCSGQMKPLPTFKTTGGQKGRCPQKCSQKIISKSCTPSTSKLCAPICPSVVSVPPKRHQDKCSDTEMLFDTRQFISAKRCSSFDITIPHKRSRTSDSCDDNDDKYFAIASANGPLEISEADPDGYYVKIRNKSNKDIDISGWSIKRLAGKNVMTYTLDCDTKIVGNGYCSVWSAGSFVIHNPPKTLVMNGKKWIVDKRMETILLNPMGEELASSQRIKRVSSSRSSSFSGGFGIDELSASDSESSSFAGHFCGI